MIEIVSNGKEQPILGLLEAGFGVMCRKVEREREQEDWKANQ